MIDLRDALEEIDSIRSQIAQGAEFRGYGPTTLAATGALALASASLQARWVPSPMHAPADYLALWIGTAAVSLALIIAEAVTRARRIHSGLAAEMLRSAVEQFVAPIVAGALLTVVLVQRSPQSLWMLPGLWEILFSLGVFASRRFLPAPVFGVGVWYLAAGTACLAHGQGEWTLSPWEMGVPFGVGQILVAAVLQFGYPRAHEDA